MKNLLKYFLGHEQTLSFITESLKETNALSIEVLKSIDFKEGHFFTLLPEDANLEGLYKFTEGILPENPRIRHGNSNSYYSIISNIREELSDLIKEKIVSNDDLISIFDNFLSKDIEKKHPKDTNLFIMKKRFTI